jgi:hypothetical protein
MDVSQIKEHLPVYAERSGGLEGASEVHIGNVDRVEGNYIKLTKKSAPDGQHHWFPIEWIREVNDVAVFLHKSVDEALAEMTDQQPAGV